ncbi:hypothetical protein RND81_11G177900 [Saponaria officinalis]|uniref:Glabrous enhancer-binding protein-like DBD domain-containing protein n=1 Tax=Saponaria officinalis TaxID=3572 RepID=A0AAW1HNF7_SAPOF
MASSKRSRPYDDPPSPESSAEEEEEIEEEEEEEDDEEQPPPTTQTPSKQQTPDSEDDDEEEDDDDSDDDVKNPVLTPKTPAESKKKVPQESDSETDSDTEPHPSQKAAANYTIKPVAKDSKPSSKAVKEKEKKASSKVSKPQLQVEEEEDGVEKKGMITRLWGFNDEIAVLQGMIDFKKEHNKDPGAVHDDFYNFIKSKLSNSKFSKGQVIDKVRRMKKKYKNNLSRASGGKDPEISNPHEFKSFQLSKIIWGNADDHNDVVSSANPKSRVKANVTENAVNNNSNNHVKSAKKIKISEKVSNSDGDMMEVDEEKKTRVVKDEKNEFGQLYPHLMKAFEVESVPRVPLLDGLKTCLTNIDSSKLEEWDKKWKEVRLAETNAYISRLALIQEQTTWFCNAMKSSKN